MLLARENGQPKTSEGKRAMQAKTGIGKMHSRGMWGQAYRATEVLCVDGKRRSARITGEPEFADMIPASVCAKGKTVSGFIVARETDGHADLVFFAYTYLKNHSLIVDARGTD